MCCNSYIVVFSDTLNFLKICGREADEMYLKGDGGWFVEFGIEWDRRGQDCLALDQVRIDRHDWRRWTEMCGNRYF